MARRTLSTDEKEAVLKMAGVLIRTSRDEAWWIADFSPIDQIVSLTSREVCIDRAFNKLIREQTK